MLTLADEVLAALPALSKANRGGVSVSIVATHMAAAETDVRRAFVRLGAKNYALLVRERTGYRLFPAGSRFKTCGTCQKTFICLPRSTRVTCTRTCAVAMSWKNPETAARRRASIRAEKLTPQARQRTVEINNRRWARPGEREKLSARNRETWADPKTAAKRTAGIRKAHRTPEKRAFYSELRRKDFQDPAYRARHLEAVRQAKASPEHRASLSESMRKRWQDPKQRAVMLAAVRRNAKKPEVRAKLSKRMKDRWADPIKGPKMREANAATETNQRKSASLKETWATPKGRRIRLSAAAKAAKTNKQRNRAKKNSRKG